MTDTTNDHSMRSLADAALYALGILTPEEHAAFESRVRSGEADSSEVRDIVEIVASLAQAGATLAPAPGAHVREAILARAAASVPTPSVVRASDSSWQPMAPGISIRELYFDAASGVHTVLARLAPGTAYPKHRHVGVEQCYVLHGDLSTDGALLHGGDFIVTSDGTTHTDTHTDGGCLLLLTTQLQDEILA